MSLLSRLQTILLVLGMITLSLYWHPLPIERDTAVYSVIAHGWLNGAIPYRDLWDHKPPGIYLPYIASQMIFGATEWSITALNILCSLLSAFSLFLIGKNLEESNSAKVNLLVPLACSFGAILSDPFLEGVQANSESFIAGLMLFALSPFIGGKTTHIFLAGVAAACIFFIKPQATLPIAFISLVALLISRTERKLAIRYLATTSAVVIILGTTLSIYFYLNNSFEKFITIVVGFNGLYTGDIFMNIIAPFYGESKIPRATYILAPFLLITILQILKTGRKESLYLIAAILGSLVSIAVTGRYYNHYFLLLVPILFWGTYLFIHHLSLKSQKLARIITLGLTTLVFSYECALTSFTPSDWSLKRHGEIYLSSKSLGTALHQKSFFNLGSEASLYFYSKTYPPSSMFYLSPLEVTKEPLLLENQIIEQLKTNTPELLVISTPFSRYIEQDTPLSKYLRSAFNTDTPNKVGYFAVAERRF